MRPGPARSAAAETLRGAGYRVRGAREPYEGTARFVERPTDLVVLSLAGYRRRDGAFLQAVKKRAPRARVLLLVPEGRRTAALQALQAGADAYVLEPFYPAELATVAAALLPRAGEEDPGEETARALGGLAGEVAHAINNPLQILALLGEASDVGDDTRRALGLEVGRIQGVMRILSRFGVLRRPQTSREPIGPTLRSSLDAAVASGDVEPVGKPPPDGPPIEIDTSQAAVAFDTILHLLAARAPQRPLAVEARVRTLPAKQPDTVEATIHSRDVDLDAAALDGLASAGLLNRDDTREVYPGLALAAAVARNHGGRLLARSGAEGVVLGLRLPLR